MPISGVLACLGHCPSKSATYSTHLGFAFHVDPRRLAVPMPVSVHPPRGDIEPLRAPRGSFITYSRVAPAPVVRISFQNIALQCDLDSDGQKPITQPVTVCPGAMGFRSPHSRELDTENSRARSGPRPIQNRRLPMMDGMQKVSQGPSLDCARSSLNDAMVSSCALTFVMSKLSSCWIGSNVSPGCVPGWARISGPPSVLEIGDAISRPPLNVTWNKRTDFEDAPNNAAPASTKNIACAEKIGTTSHHAMRRLRNRMCHKYIARASRPLETAAVLSHIPVVL